MWPYMFAYVFAAKVGCGLVAEVGSMRIAEELDTLNVMAIDPMKFVIATRLLAVWITVPFMYALAIVFGTLGSFLVIIVQFNVVSLGQWISLHFQSQTLMDNLFSMTKAVSFATVITLVGLYYGWRASGGPEGVGAATARSMMVNLVLIHVIGGALTAVFWGTGGRIPFGGSAPPRGPCARRRRRRGLHDDPRQRPEAHPARRVHVGASGPPRAVRRGRRAQGRLGALGQSP